VLLDTPLSQSARKASGLGRDFKRRGPLVIVGYDGSPQAHDAVELAAERAGPGGTVIAVHVLPPAPAHLGTPYYERAVEANQMRGQQLLRELVDGSTAAARLRTELFHGTPAEVLSRLARSRGADEILIGSRGLGRWRSLLRKSVSQQLLRLADRPVLVVPTGAVSAKATLPSPRGLHTRRQRGGRRPSGSRHSRTRSSERRPASHANRRRPTRRAKSATRWFVFDAALAIPARTLGRDGPARDPRRRWPPSRGVPTVCRGPRVRPVAGASRATYRPL